MADYLERMKEKKSENPYLQRMREKNAQNALNEIQSGLANMSSIASNLYTDTYERYKGGNDTYRTDSKDWLNKTSSASSNFQAGYNRVNQLLDNYKGIFDENWANDIRNALSSYSENIKKITDNAAQEDSFWSNFKDENAYNSYKTYTTADIDALSKEISDLEETYKKAREYSSSRVSQTYWGKLLSDKGYSGDNAGLKQIQKDINEKKAFLDTASMYQNGIESADLSKLVKEAMQSPDFEKYSAEGNAIKNPSYAETVPYIFHEGKAVENPVTFARDNKDELALAYMNGGYVPTNYKYRNFTDDEVSAYNYYLAAEKAGLVEPGTAENFLQEATNVLNQREGEGIVERLPDNILGDLLLGAYAGSEQFVSGLEGIGRSTAELVLISANAPVITLNGICQV